jgi:hypothetical protein
MRVGESDLTLVLNEDVTDKIRHFGIPAPKVLLTTYGHPEWRLFVLLIDEEINRELKISNTYI